MNTRFPIVAFLLSISLPVMAFAYTKDTEARAQIDREFRQCEAQAYDTEIEARIEAYARYHDQYRIDLETYRTEIFDARMMDDAQSSSQEQTAAERAFSQRQKENKSQLDTELSQNKRTLSEARTACRQTRDQALRDLALIEKNLNAVCTSDNQCSPTLQCSTSLGVCNRSCSTNDFVCKSVCRGTCVKRTALIPNSCQPYICADDARFPSCTSDGQPMYYYTNPCLTHGGGGLILK